jgi:hypothetical protein
MPAPDINNINGNPAIETDEPLSIQEANEWAIEVRGQADPRKAAIERLKCAAAQRRERKPANPLNALKPDPSYKVGTFNAEAGAFNIESNDGKKLLGQSLSNGNVRNGQKVRSFFTPNGRVVIDVKPKGRDIIIPKPEPKVSVEEPDIWAVTSCFLYSKLKGVQEDFTDNIATDLTSYDAWQSVFVTGTSERVILFTQTSTLMGDYKTAADALSNNLKEDRKLKPGNTGAGSGGAADDAAWGSGSPDARIIWYYIGDPEDILQNGKIFKVTGPPLHPSAGNITNSGPGFVMQVYSSGIASAIFPSETMGTGPLTKKLKESFPNLGGQIGYAGRIEKWRGQQDYASSGTVFYFRNLPSATTTPQTPVSFPPGYIQGSTNPWLATGTNWFQFGWPDPQYIGCASSSWVNAENSAFTGVCGESIPNDKWYWGGDATPNYGRIDKDNPGGYIGTSGIFVCWKGHKDNAGLAMSFFEAFKDYWGITGTVTVLGSVNPFGCGIGDDPGGGGGYPPPPPGLRRFLVKQLGRKAEIWLKVCEKDYPPIELKLPFEFAALIEKFVIQGAPSVNTFPNNQQSVFLTLASNFGIGYALSLECPHATMSTDGEFIYIDILYGAERIWEEPLSKPIPCKLSNLGTGDFTGITWYRQPGHKENGSTYIIGQYKSPGTVEIAPRYKADYFTYCQSYKIALPTSPTDRVLTIVGSQRYRRGETIQLTAPSPDNEFNNKFLIIDFRTDKLEGLKVPFDTNTFASWQAPNSEYASFGGLPALLQIKFPGHSIPSLAYFNAIEKFYKPQSVWTDMDWIHFELQEAPETFYPLNTVLPVGVFIAPNTSSSYHHVRFILDGKFGRGSRAASIDRPSTFGYQNKAAPTYFSFSATGGGYLLYTSFKEQLIGSGIKNDQGLVTKWNRMSTYSFPIFGQLSRNGF